MPPKKNSKARRLVQAAKPVIKLVTQPSRDNRSVGSKIGGWVGDMAQKALMSITGMGDYTVKQNSFVTGNSPPVFEGNGRHSITVRHREFVGLVVSQGSGFSVTTYYINPTSALFPWLAALATNFELYKFRGLVFDFCATSATAVSSTNTALGSVILATQYNALSPPFASQVQMEAYEFSTSTVAFTSCIHPVECAPGSLALSELYTDLGFAQGDPRFTVMGILNVATVGQQAASTLGELWASYDVDLIRPRLFGVFPSQGYTFRIASAVGASAPSANDVFAPLATAQKNNASNGYGTQGITPNESTLDVTIGSSSIGTGGGVANTIFFPVGLTGYFRIQFYLVGNATPATLAYPAAQVTGGMVLQAAWNNGGASSQLFPPNGSSTATFFSEFAVSVGIGPFGVSSGTPALTLVSGGTFPGVGTTGQYFLDIFQYNS